MVHVELTPHLFEHFPELKGKALTVEATTVAEVVTALDRIAPGLALYVCDEHGCLRTHVNVFVGEDRVIDRRTLGDRVSSGGRIYIMQALSGG